MECGQCYSSQPFVVLTFDQFVGHGGGPLEPQRQDSHVYRKTGTLYLIFRKFLRRKIGNFGVTIEFKFVDIVTTFFDEKI